MRNNKQQNVKISEEDLARIRQIMQEEREKNKGFFEKMQDNVSQNQISPKEAMQFVKDNPEVLKLLKFLEKGGKVDSENYDMLRGKIKEVEHHAKELKSITNRKKQVPAWVLAKSTRASTDLSDITHYMDSQKFSHGGGVHHKEREINEVSNWDADEIANYLGVPISYVVKDRNRYVREAQSAMMLNSYGNGGEISSYSVGDILKFKDGEDWRVVKVKDKFDKLVIKPHNEKAKSRNISLEIEVTSEYLKNNLINKMSEGGGVKDSGLIEKGAKKRLAEFFRIPINKLDKFKFDGTDDIKELSKSLNSTSDEGTKLYYDMAIQMSREDGGDYGTYTKGGGVGKLKGEYYILSEKEKKNLTNSLIELKIPKNLISIPTSLPASNYYGFLFRVTLSKCEMFDIGFSILSVQVNGSVGRNGNEPELWIEISGKTKGVKKEVINDSYYIKLSSDFSTIKKMSKGGGVEESGLYVIGSTAFDNGKISDLIEDESLYAEWNAREGYWFFPEEVENYDNLEKMLEELFYINGVQARIEGVFGEGGGIGFKGLSNKVAKRYAGKSVEPKYQSEYGKRYSKSEAREVGDKVAGKVYWQQQGRKFTDGGGVDNSNRTYKHNIYDLINKQGSYSVLYNKITSHPAVYSFDIESMSGVFVLELELSFGLTKVYATPYFDEKLSIPIDVVEEEGDEVKYIGEIPAPNIHWTRADDFANWYYSEIDSIGDKVEEYLDKGKKYTEGGGVDSEELPHPYNEQWENLLKDFDESDVMLMFPNGANGYYISRTRGNYSDDAIRQSLKSMTNKYDNGGSVSGLNDLLYG